ncbi:hypothetical protein GRF29_106g1059389 [Pseudopithomyces chartarum]|uniref:MPN domain-containing protein n=1 Tax=Pseudopithomyces chartarum TaxID=1892770 RepID=A0AAN6LXA8_9PLEO|nr:hypothetical protein GRF29_106g1059389 [Pseudopithomyces chartarum]
MADALKDSPIKAVQIEALVVMKLVNHAAKTFPTVATGSLVGMESHSQPGLLEVTSCFPFATIDAPTTDDHRDNSTNLAAAAPRAKANIAYQNEMIKLLREVNVDANNVGWYTSTSMGNFINLNTIENQFFFQKDPNERAIALVHDDPNTPEPPFFPNYDSLDLSIDPFLEKTCDLLLESIENHHTELNNHQYYQRSLAREQAKITAWQQKRKAENAARTASKQPLLPEDEWQRLFKLPQEPNRLETMLNSRQVEQYARQVDGFTAGVSSKMFAVKSNLLPGES